MDSRSSSDRDSSKECAKGAKKKIDSKGNKGGNNKRNNNKQHNKKFAKEQNHKQINRNTYKEPIKKEQEGNYEMFSKNYKSKPCEFYRKGVCKKGDECTYRHNFELKVLDKICKFHLSNSCYKQNCLYSHD